MNGRIIFSFHHNRKDRNRASSVKRTIDRIDNEKLPDALSARFLVTCKAPDEYRWYGGVAGQLSRDVRRDFVWGQCEGT